MNVSGDLGELNGGNPVFPNGDPARGFLSPYSPLTTYAGEVRIGGVEVTLETDGTFSVDDVPPGDYQFIVRYYDGATRQARVAAGPVSVFGDAVVTWGL